ncbi:glycosyl transferase group 1 [[Phormidium ambiguum] IAM M-71]|uniref:Glycosyl transferase group 1 n=1 Tax=[Phormidium ambiguum] IAM M-71 TaxID=454136 RepID=A0A1U7I2V8_9CYAN|nr:methyltransferase domain-containing protein [Phormidium ambiguum]OKH30413.1 glycosyl transferase group 1 [Phormidium ambiguum IAM M-71]
MKCKICRSETTHFAKATILEKYDIDYFKCENCGFVQTEEPYWLSEAYTNAIASSDVGLVFRNLQFSQITSNIIFSIFDDSSKFLDYGGGYGLFVRLMRDAGFDFYWYDKFCENIFAKGFATVAEEGEYELVTAFEVFEHFSNPLTEIQSILKFSRNIFFSTELLPENNPKPGEWWYYSLQDGQHIAIYTAKSLAIIAETLGLNYYTNGLNLHLITEKQIPEVLFRNLCYAPPPNNRKESLITKDYLQVTGQLKEIEESSTNKIVAPSQKKFKVIIDGVFFQSFKTGIARLWKSLLEEWVKDGFAENILVLDRGGSAPKISGINYRNIQLYNYNMASFDREALQEICDEENADIFISTYYTTPISTPSVFMAYDMIPEVLGWDLTEQTWQEKHFGLRHGTSYITISENTAKDLVKFFPDISPESVTVSYCGIDSNLSPASTDEINNFRNKYGINKPYFLLVGARTGYKNGILFFQGFAKLDNKYDFDIVCSSFDPVFEDEFRVYTSGCTVHKLQLNDRELKVAYSGAVALVFPSQYEGFGLPVLEALACGCPVITCPISSIPEVAGDAAYYVNYDDVEGMVNALTEVQKPEIRNLLIERGLTQARKFSWKKMADEVRLVLIKTSLLGLNLREVNIIIFPDWLQPEESLYSELTVVIKSMGTHISRNQMTLLIDISNISENSEIDINLFLSSIVMDLLMEEDIDVTDGLEISPVDKLDSLQWEVLLPRLHSRISLNHENEEAIAKAKAETLRLIQLDSLANIEFVSEAETN